MAKLAELPARPRASLFPRVRAAVSLDVLAIALVVAVAAATRLTYLDLAEFKGDESHVLGLAALLLDQHVFPLIGIVSSVGINNPPIFVYLMAIPLLFSRDPAFASGFVGLFGVGAAALSYRFCAEHFDRRTARIAALLFAASSFAIVYNRKLQEQDIVPFFVVLWMGSLFRFARGGGPRHLVGVAFWLSVLVQLHQASVALIPITVLALALRRRLLRNREALRWGAGAIALAGALWIPYLAFQLTHGWADLHALLRLERQPVLLDFQQFAWVVDLAASNGYDGLTGIGYAGYAATTYSFDEVYLLERLLVYAGFAYLGVRLVRTRGRDWRYVFLLLWLLVPPLFFVRSTSTLYPHYFLTVYPVQYILVGLAVSAALGRIEQLLPRWRTAALGLVGVAVAAIVAVQVYGLVTVMNYIATAPTLGGHGVPLRERETAIDHLVAFAAGSNKPVEIASGGADYPLAFAYLADHRVPQRFFDDHDTFVSPAPDGRPTLYLTSDPDQPVPELLRQDFPGDRLDLIPFPGQTTGFEIYRLPPDAGARILGDPSIRPIGRTAPNGVRIVGYQVAPSVGAGGALRLALYWQVVAAPPKGTSYAFFNHLIDGNGDVWGQQDGMGYDPTSWKPGDVVISWFTLDTRADLPAGVGWVETGLYDRHGIQRLPLRAADGPAADRILLGPIKLVPAKPAAVPAPGHRQTAEFGRAIDLVGYDLGGAPTPGGVLQVTLTWSARANPGADYTGFVHLLNSSGRIVAQSDGQPGIYPTSLWAPGEIERDPHSITLPRNLPVGTYHLEVGLYRRDTMARLPTASGDRVVLDASVGVGG